MLVLGMVANYAGSFFGFDVEERPICHKFMSKLVSALDPPEDIVDSFIHAAVINLTKKIPAN